MRKRRSSDGILFKRRSNPSSRSGRRVRKIPDWTILSKIRRLFPDGIRRIAAPQTIDVFADTGQWNSFFSAISNPPKSEMTVDLSGLEFMYPEAVVYFACICDHLLRKTNVIIREMPPGKSSVDGYLDTAGLRKFFAVNKQKKNQEPQFYGDCIPISRDPLETTSTGRKMAELLISHARLAPNQEQTMSEAFGEIMGNAIDHGEVREWYRIAQIHPTRKQVSVAIADNGVGIPHTLRSGYKSERFINMSDSEVIKCSLEPDVTRFEPKVGESHGYGLTRAMAIAEALDAQLAILSGRGLYRVKFQNGLRTEELLNFKSTLPGTLITLRIPL